MAVGGSGSTQRDAPPDTPLDVLIVGAGPTGLALAVELRAYGVRFRIIDRAADRVHESRALGVQPRTLEVLARHGLAAPLVALGNPAVRLRLHTGGRTVPLRLFDIGVSDTAYPYLLFVSQARTERVLGEHLAAHGVQVERRVELTGLDAGADHVTCRLAHQDDRQDNRQDDSSADGREETVRARWVVGCDGAHSAVRQQAGIGFGGHAYPQTFFLADLTADGLEPDAVHAFLGGAGMMFFFPLDEPAPWRMLAMRGAGDPGGPVTLELLQAAADRYTGGEVRLRDPVWLTDFRLHNRGASGYRAGRVFLAGDAAHIHSPAGAQGMNTGIQDAVNLGWKLALALRGADPALLDSYHAERAPIGKAVLRFTDRAFTVATTSNPVVRFARIRLVARVAPLATRFTLVRRIAFRTVSELGIRYRHSPIVAGRRRGRGPKPGDRLPDAAAVLDGHRSTLHAALAAPGYHVLLCGPFDAGAVAAMSRDLTATYRDLVTVHRVAGGDALRRLGSPSCYAVRPDGYIGYRSHGAELAGLRDYLARWLP
jgi:2-polyprenyl-6-methoxyphenol hydroxylase-like FAD-dependent oxidoreductase